MKNTSYFNRDTIPYFLFKRATNTPLDIAYSFPEFQQNYSWSTIWFEVRLVAKGFLQLGIKKGDSIALLMQGRMELIISMYAAACIGAVVVPLNTYSKKNELQTYLKDSRPVALIIGIEGHHLHYSSILQEIISECKLSAADSSWIPANIFVLDDEVRISAPFRHFSELSTLSVDGDEQAFRSVCQSTSAKDALILLYTSGTAGTPKAVLRSTASFLVSTNESKSLEKQTSFIQRMIDRIARKFSLLNLLPLYHIGGFATIFSNLKVCNIRIVMLSHFNPLNALSVLEKEKCQLLSGTPYMIQQMLSLSVRSQFNLKSLLGVIFTSAAVNNSVLQRVTREWSLYFFMVSYGSSEAGAVANGVCFVNRKNNPLLSFMFKLLRKTNIISGLINNKEFEKNAYSLAGKVGKRVELKILHLETEEPVPLHEQGEIVIRSHQVMQYAKENKERTCFTKDGWYKSGDLGFLDEKGHLTITGRLLRIISRGGEKISPVEIENALLLHKDVDEAFVIGIADEMYGEQVCACIVAKKEANLTSEKLRNDLAPYMSAFKIPRYFVFLSYIPLASTGKISVSEIRTLALDQIGELRKNA